MVRGGGTGPASGGAHSTDQQDHHQPNHHLSLIALKWLVPEDCEWRLNLTLAATWRVQVSSGFSQVPPSTCKEQRTASAPSAQGTAWEPAHFHDSSEGSTNVFLAASLMSLEIKDKI